MNRENVFQSLGVFSHKKKISIIIIVRTNSKLQKMQELIIKYCCRVGSTQLRIFNKYGGLK
jgi:anti-sigma-K factor RskA